MDESKLYKKGETEILCSIIPFAEFRAGIRPLREENPLGESLPPILLAYGVMQYLGDEIYERVLFFPVKAVIAGEDAGFIATYNVSDECVRSAGIFVKEKFRGLGVGMALLDFSLALWPASFKKFLGYYRSDSLGFWKKAGLSAPVGFIPRHNMKNIAEAEGSYQIQFMAKGL